jgi:hypothetical protein
VQLGLVRALAVLRREDQARPVISAAVDALARIAPEQRTSTIDRKLAAAQQLKDSLTSRAREPSTGTTRP